MLRTLFVFFALGSAPALFATTVGADGTTCPTASLAVYESLGSAGCTVNGLTYNNFTFLASYSNGSTPTPTADQILLSPGGGSGAALSIAYPVLTRNYVSFNFQYDFDPVPAVGDTGMDLDVTGDVDVFQTLCPGGTFMAAPKGCFGRVGDQAPVNLEVFNQHLGATKLSDSAPIIPAVTNGEIQLYFVLNGTPNAPAGFDSLTATLSSSAVPEPGSSALLAGGVLLLSAAQVVRRRTRQRS